MKKGFFSIDGVVGLVIFLMIVAVSFYYMAYSTQPKEPFSAALKTAGLDFAEKIEENITWAVYRIPIIVDSNNASKATIEKGFFPDADVDSNSIIMEDENLTEINSDFADNTIVFAPGVAAGKNNYYVIYTKDTALSKRTYDTDLNATGIWVNNSLMNVSFATSGLSKIGFNGIQIIQGAGANFSTSSVPTLSYIPVRAERVYDNGVKVRIYNNNSKIIVTSNHTFDATIYVTKSFTSYYNGSANSIGSSGLQFNSIIDFLDVYGSSGIAVIGNSMNVSLYNNTYNEIHLHNATDFEIYLHEGTYTNALLEKDMYLNPPEVLLLVPEEIKGTSQALLEELNTATYEAIKDNFATGIDFNLTVYNTTIGVERPNDITVIAIKYPVCVLDRFGKTNTTTFDVAVWMG